MLFAGQDAGLRVTAGDVVPALLASAHAFLHERAAASGKPAWRLRELPDGPARVARRTAAALGITRTSPAPAAPATAPVPLVGVLEQEDGLFAAGAMVPLGRLVATAVDALARASRVVITPTRGVVVPDLQRDDAAAWVSALAAAGLAVEADSRWSGVTACAGKPACAKALADVRADADATTRYVDGLPVHWIGCARGCGSPSGRHVRVEATPAGYVVTREPSAAAPTVTGAGSTIGVGPVADGRLADLVAAARRG
ncbi:MAG TPA: hypothetical protein VGB74_04645 [Actinoplanes sp.]